MTHPIGEIATAVTVVAAIGAGTVLVLPREKPQAETVVVLDVSAKTDAQRVADLERRLNAIGVEQKELAEALRAAVASRKARGNDDVP